MFFFLICAAPILGLLAALGYLMAHFKLVNGQLRSWMLLLGLVLLGGGYAGGYALTVDDGYLFGLGQLVFYVAAFNILLLTGAMVWRSHGRERVAVVLGGLLAGLMIPLALNGRLEHQHIRRQDCMAETAIAWTADQLEDGRRLLPTRPFPPQLHGHLRLEDAVADRGCTEHNSALYAHIHGYNQPTWLYHQRPDGYDLAYWYRPRIFGLLGKRICLYSRASAEVTCSFTYWGPFTESEIRNYALE